MHSVKLKIDEKIYDHLLWLFSKFSKDELVVEFEEPSIDEQKSYLQRELNEMNEGDGTVLSVNEVEQRLEKVIKKHEDRL